jgi:hypothetical protein
MARNDGRKLTIEVVGDTKAIKKDVASVNKTIGGLSKGAKMAGGVIAGAFAVDTVIDFAKGAIDAASDLQESMSKVKVVFGDSADEIVAWSRTSVQAMAMSQQEALEAAGTFGNLFDSLGLTNDAATDMSKGIVQLAADLGSFNNVGTEETLLALRSGLLGEAEPMRKFGSALSAARVEAYALSRGIVKNKADLTEAQKVQIRYQLILEDTKNAHGDVARSSGNLAIKQKQLDGSMKDLTASIGAALIGPMAGVTDWLNKLISGPSGGKLQSAADKWKELNQTIAETKPPAEGTWFGGGTVFDSALDGLNAVNKGVVDFLVPQRQWADQMRTAGEAAGFTRDEMLYLAKAVKEGGGTLEDYKRIIEEAILDTKMAGKATQQAAFAAQFGWGWWNKATEDAATTTKVAVKKVAIDLGALVGISKTTLGATRDEIKSRMKDIKDALEHPFRERKLEKTYQSAIREATKKMNQALRTGNAEAYAEAKEFVRIYKAKLRELRMQKFRIRVSMFIDAGNVSGPGATLLGGMAGAAMGGRRKPKKPKKPKNHAAGIGYVPFDNYPANLHRGETVLSAQESRMGAMGSSSN